ncbi:MAG: hypothetical protein ACP5HQ_02535 [Thermoprotei archaeon]
MADYWLSMAELFTISFFSNLLPFGGAPYTLIGTFKVEELGLTTVIIVTALGAALAKVPLYYFGFEANSLFKRNKNYGFFKSWVERKSFLVALFITAVLPGLPLDDFLYLWAGALKSNVLKMLSVTLAAKLLKSSLEIPIEYYSLTVLSNVIHVDVFGSLYAQLALIATFVVLGIVLFVIDWQSIINKVKSMLPWASRSSSRGSFPFM